MYLLTIKDGLGTRHIGPYASPKHASDDLDRELETCSERARWQIHALETPDRSLELQPVASCSSSDGVPGTLGSDHCRSSGRCRR